MKVTHLSLFLWAPLCPYFSVTPLPLFGESPLSPCLQIHPSCHVCRVTLSPTRSSGVLTTICCCLLYSIDKVERIESVVLVIHGTEDEVINIAHGRAIYARCPRTVEPLWVAGAGHNDIEHYDDYLQRLSRFLTLDVPTS